MTKAANKPKVLASSKKTKSHFNDPLDKTPGRVGGYSRRGDHASPEVKNIVIAEIRNVAKAVGFANKDIANLLAFAEIESGFNPDAATRHPKSSASGVFQITDQTAADVLKNMLRALKNEGLEQYTAGLQLDTYHRFDYQSNIHHGIVVYLEKKRRARNRAYIDAQALAKQKGEDISKVEKNSYAAIADDIDLIYSAYHSKLKKDGKIKEQYKDTLKKLKENRARYLDAIEKDVPITLSSIEAQLIEKDRISTPEFSYPLVVIQERKTGRNELFLDTITGQKMTREELITHIHAGKYLDYKIVLIDGVLTPVSKPDKQTANNLG